MIQALHDLAPHLQLLIALAIGAMACFLTLIPLIPLARRLRIMDQPGKRSSHEVPTPRAGGLAILISTAVGVLLISPGWNSAAFLVGAGLGAAVAVISFLDDAFTLPSLPRFIVHIGAAAGVIHLVHLEVIHLGIPYVDAPLPQTFATLFAVLFAAAFINFFNFMDGINGIAAFQTLFGGITIAILLLWSGGNRSVLIAAALAGAALGFLPHNFPKSRVFMGDIGSATIGFALAMLTFVGAKTSDIPWAAYVIPLGVFLYDATFTLIKRMIRKERFWKPHREHHYQLLIRAGWSHKRVTLLNATMMCICCIAALLYADANQLGRLMLIIGLLLMFGSYSFGVHSVFSNASEKQANLAAQNVPEPTGQSAESGI